ncbi:MAG: methionine biosynthesis protein MetW [Alphaproteobacteria bacterium]|nr:methionine biosynthesis protein MetW [Alphaproteobacteria bacterium]
MTEIQVSRRLPAIRADLQRIAEMVTPGSRVLDIGCGDGGLLDYLVHEKEVDGRGIEIRQERVHLCVSRGLSVIQGDAETDLKDYPAQSFDYVVLSQTLQAMHTPKEVLLQMLRISRRAIVSFHNFGYWRVRFDLLLRGHMPTGGAFNRPWYETTNIHNCTIRDFVDLCHALDIVTEKQISLDHAGRAGRSGRAHFFPNLFGEQAVFLLRRKSS